MNTISYFYFFIFLLTYFYDIIILIIYYIIEYENNKEEFVMANQNIKLNQNTAKLKQRLEEMDEQFYHLAIRVFLLSFSLLSSVYMKLVVKNYLCRPLHSTANISHNLNSSTNIMLVNTVVNSYFYYI